MLWNVSRLFIRNGTAVYRWLMAGGQHNQIDYGGQCGGRYAAAICPLTACSCTAATSRLSCHTEVSSTPITATKPSRQPPQLRPQATAYSVSSATEYPQPVESSGSAMSAVPISPGMRQISGLVLRGSAAGRRWQLGPHRPHALLF